MSTVDSLTPREREVLALMAAGRTNAEISEALSISFPTAKAHVSAILAKFEVTSREEAVARSRSEAATRRLRAWAPWFLLGIVGAGSAAAVAVGFVAFRPAEAPPSNELHIDLGELAPGEPTRFVVAPLGETPYGNSLGVWVTRGTEEGHATVFFDRDPHTGCAVGWQPDFKGGGYTIALDIPGEQYLASFTGAFRDPCGGWVYLKGDARVVFGASPRGLDSFDFALTGDDLVIHLDRPILGLCREPVAGPCSPQGAPVLVAEPPPPAIPTWGRR